MKIAGIIAEYNPFHNGHAYHIRETRVLTGCDYVVACMDGHFTQRGEPTSVSKWNRVRMALTCGVDAVFELPALYAVRTADAFARGGVDILGGLGVDVLSFGSELSDIEVIRRMADIIENEPTSVSETVKAALARGESHAKARGNAIAEYLELPPEMVNRPNLLLGAEYLRAIQAGDYDMEPFAVQRRGDYHDEEETGKFASASAIRAALARGESDVVGRCIPVAAQPFMDVERLHPMDDLLIYRLRSLFVNDLAELPDMSEGLEHRLYKLCRETGTREELLRALKCKRYTHARLSRMLTHALLGYSNETMKAHPHPACARLLGMRRGAEPLLKELKRRSKLPIAASASELRDDAAFQLECHATDVWALLHDAPELRLPGRELTEKFLRL